MDELIIREAKAGDLDGLLQLYLDLHEQSVLTENDRLSVLWNDIIKDGSYHIFVGLISGLIVSSCTLVVIKNLTRNMSPYSIIENVVTAKDYRRRGYGLALLHKAVACAKQSGCYKVMLLTGSKQESTMRFYEQACFNRSDKTGFVMWL